MPHHVHIIVESTFGERLAGLPKDEPVWIVASPENQTVAQRLWHERQSKSHLNGITTFQPNGRTCEETLLAVLDTIDLHHGKHSAKPPYSMIAVIGCRVSEDIRSALRNLGFEIAIVTKDGFSAQRTAYSV